MITRYNLSYNENPRTLARKVKETMTVTVRSRHQKAHEESVCEATMFHLFNGETLPLAQFIEKYGNE